MGEGPTEQSQDMVFALDIGTRSIIGIVGRAEGDRFHVLAIEKQEHNKRAMIDGQIEDIEQVGRVAAQVTARLGQRMGCRLSRVCIAAAGRALHTEQGHFELELPEVRRINDDLISQLEAGAVFNAESALSHSDESFGQFFLVGYTVSRYQLDNYPFSTLRGHNGRKLEVDVVATFLPAEVVESLYAAMRVAELEVISLTLEPIAAINAAIPPDLRLLNLVMADIGAGTSDIAICQDGSVVGYTMATVAGDEITETIMRSFLVDFATAERIKIGLSSHKAISFTDILGLEQTVDAQEIRAVVEPAVKSLAKELAHCILQLNGGMPSAVFLAGGGSKLEGLREAVSEALNMDPRRVAVAGANFKASAFADGQELADPEYATPLGIAVSAALGLISDSYRVFLNGQPARLFRSGVLTALDILMMNGYTYAQLLGRTGQSLLVNIDGERKLFRGEPAVPSVLRINGQEKPPSTVIQTGDSIEFTPAQMGRSAVKTLEEVLGGSTAAASALVNGAPAVPDYMLRSGDEICTNAIVPLKAPQPEAPQETADTGSKENEPELAETASPVSEPEPAAEEMYRVFILNGKPLQLPAKPGGMPYYLMDLLDHSGLDFKHLNRPVVLTVNGKDGQFTQVLQDGDAVTIKVAE